MLDAVHSADDTAEVRNSRAFYALTLWGVLGFCLLIVRAIWRLTPLAYAPIREGNLTDLQIAVGAIWVVFMLYSEGYKGFQRKLAPRLVARAMYLARHPRLHHAVLAPLFCMGLFHATRKRMITSWSVLAAIVALIVLVHQLEQPWRGIVDVGVVLGLVWGLVAVLVYLVLGLSGRSRLASPDLPEPDELSAE